MKRQKNRGPKPLPHELRRQHCVSCRFAKDELARLDEARGQISRGKWLRLAAFSHGLASRPIIPPINQEAWASLARVGGNLNQLTRRVNLGDHVDVDDILACLEALRSLLLGAHHSLQPIDEKHES